MANPNFHATLSSNEIWRDQDLTRCLTDDLDTIEANISLLEANKAHVDHTHAGYASAGHSHSEYAPITHGHSGYASANHSHDKDYISKVLQMTDDAGSSEYLVKVADGKSLPAVINDLPVGLHTVYSESGVTGNPKPTEAWRMLVHKTADTIGWILAFGSEGSIYGNYKDKAGIKGWAAIFDAAPKQLWSHPSGSGYYMTGGQSITPTKKLSECRNGWVIIWSDFDGDTNTVHNYDEYCTYIFKKNATCANWNGQTYLCLVPHHAPADDSTNSVTIKTLNVFDDKLVGEAKNGVGSRRDVVLRAVYEF